MTSNLDTAVTITDEMVERAADFLWKNVGLLIFANATCACNLHEPLRAALEAALSARVPALPQVGGEVAKEYGLRRSFERWRNMMPSNVAAGSTAQVEFALTDAKTDLAEFERVLKVLAEPTAVHGNMLRGTIAKPSFEQIKHLYAEEFAALASQAVETKAVAPSTGAGMVRVERLEPHWYGGPINPRHFEILCEAMAEVKATSDGLSDQPIADIVAGCIEEIAALEPVAVEAEPPEKPDKFAYWNSLPESEKQKIRQDFHNDMYGGTDD